MPSYNNITHLWHSALWNKRNNEEICVSAVSVPVPHQSVRIWICTYCIPSYPRHQTPTHPRSAFYIILGNAFNSNAEKEQQISWLFYPSQETSSIPLWLPPALLPFIITLCSTLFLHLSLPSSGSFSGQPTLMLCLVRPQSPKGVGVLNKMLIKHFGYSWGIEEGGGRIYEETADWDTKLRYKTGNTKYYAIS